MRSRDYLRQGEGLARDAAREAWIDAELERRLRQRPTGELGRLRQMLEAEWEARSRGAGPRRGRPRGAPGKRSRTLDLAAPPARIFRDASSEAIAADADDRVAEARAAAGRPLDPAVADSLHATLGVQVDRVRVHDDAAADAAADAIGARAFAIGDDLFFRAGAYRPDTEAGQRLIAHEVAHTRQAVSPSADGELDLSEPGDAAEVEAEAFADTFVGALHAADRARRDERRGAEARVPARQGRVDRNATGGVEADGAAHLHDVLGRGGGDRLPGPLAARLSGALGRDVAHVRVHTDARSAEAADAIGAAAFAFGDEIFFARGRYQPDSTDGERLIAHEVAHTVQQRGAGAAAGELTISEPGDHHEREADAFADAFVRPSASPARAPASPIIRPSADPWITPVVRRMVQAERDYRPRSPVVTAPETAIVSVSDIELFGATTPFDRTWPILPSTFVPLASGTFLVEGVPITAALSMQASAHTGASLSLGRGVLQQARVFVTGSEAARQRRPRAVSVFPLIPILPLPAPGPPRGRFGADAMLRFDAHAQANARAEAGLQTQLGVFGNVFNAGAFAGLTGSARANANVEFEGAASFHYDNGVADASVELDLNARAGLDFEITANAGVWVELRFPEIPVVTDLSHRVQSWPLLGWIVPDLTRWHWRRDYRKEWPVFRRSYDWQLHERINIGGRSPGATGRGAMTNDRGFDITQLLRDLQATQRAGQMVDDPVGAGAGRRNGNPGDVTRLAARARAAIAAVRQSTQRELRTNTQLLGQARRSAAAAPHGGAPSLAIGSGSADPVTALQTRETKLHDAEASSNQLTDKTTELATPAAAVDGPSRNQAAEGYQSVAANAEALKAAIDADQGPFAVPEEVSPSYLGARRVPGTNLFEGSFGHPDWTWASFPNADIQRHPINAELGLRSDTNQATIRAGGHYRYTGRRTTGAAAIANDLEAWRRRLEDQARQRTTDLMTADPSKTRQVARREAEWAIADEWAARGYPRHRFDHLLVRDHTGWECHHAQETSWDGQDGKSNLIYLILADHSPFTGWFDRRRDDIKSNLHIP